MEAHNQSFRDRYGRLFKQVLPEKLSKTFWLIHFTPRAYDAYHIMIRHIGSSLVHSMRGIVRARKHVVYIIIYQFLLYHNQYSIGYVISIIICSVIMKHKGATPYQRTIVCKGVVGVIVNLIFIEENPKLELKSLKGQEQQGVLLRQF